MNAALRRVSMTVLAMVVVLLANATYVQVINADHLRLNPLNKRVSLDEYSRQRGQISADGQPLAVSVPTDDRYKYLRTYPTSPLAYAPVTGFYSMHYGSTGLELAENQVLNGSDDRLFGRRFFDLLSGRDPRGGNVVTTIKPRMQQVAYDELTSKGFRGSVVAIEPSTGNILAMVSTPSFDPNLLAGHNPGVVAQNKDLLESDPDHPTLNRAVSQRYAPGSTFKVVVAAGALSNGASPDQQVTAAPSITLPGTNTQLPNYGNSHCGPGGGATTTLTVAFAESCNTAFAELGIQLTDADLRAQAEAFGIESTSTIPIEVAASTVGAIEDDAELGQASIGQKNVALTPMQNAVIAATVANGGLRMEPHLVAELQGPDYSDLATTRPASVEQAISRDVAAQLTNMMIEAEKHAELGIVNGSLPSAQIASKTGTAEHGDGLPPNAWYIAFAPADDPKIAIAVIVEDGGDRGQSATGASVAAPIARAVIAAGLDK
ncbi:penicillin-binding protein 2 [Antrihabitans sp. YC2-6]|uniref:peptidoglycan D,D-transpeptidase FtsI family protein n=1 Tax=Antrihabitans sp. YC2-6 TaxID=2799498 RepID=UPI0018F2AD85|nr:penicillin-binding protein 2 [Antrihabitans sp. YC2-6]MBJ8346407.1 penicillin-binding protein 2 [Antrihabitans sp. YC2-6]